ncbi:MAG TPA: hypothetical protein VL242_32110 [Sorangium sp.]|nr:hypothetical protein [Sorangium sp.]
MASDFKRGAILPPVVVGVLVRPEQVEAATSWSSEEFQEVLRECSESNISIIDGMQRTTVLRAIRSDAGDRQIRVEFWLSGATANLTYRMLVLNTGQVPWNLRRQIEVINASFVAELRSAIGGRVSSVEICGIDDNRRRFSPGVYQANDVVEMYLAFGLRKAHVDKESVLADQFSRLDMIEAVSEKAFFETFVKVFEQLARFDHAVSRMDASAKVSSAKKQRFDGGRSLFDSQPACVGFMTAAAQKIYGRPGISRPPAQAKQHLRELLDRCQHILAKVTNFAQGELQGFLDFGTLNEVLDRPAGKIGDFERTLFVDAFRLLFEEDVTSMTPCWRAQ